jgi:hypothetical protein
VVKGFFPHKQKILGSNPVPACPERRALRTQISCINANPSSRPNDQETMIEGPYYLDSFLELYNFGTRQMATNRTN